VAKDDQSVNNPMRFQEQHGATAPRAGENKLQNCAAPFEGLRAALEGRHLAPAPLRANNI